MDDFEDCENEECWYKGNLDRRNEFTKGEMVVANWSEGELSLPCNTQFPTTVELCDVCAERACTVTCVVCSLSMVDKGVQIKTGEFSNQFVCRVCVAEYKRFREQRDGESAEDYEEKKDHFILSSDFYDLGLEKDENQEVLKRIVARGIKSVEKQKKHDEAVLRLDQARATDKLFAMLKAVPEKDVKEFVECLSDNSLDWLLLSETTTNVLELVQSFEYRDD